MPPRLRLLAFRTIAFVLPSQIGPRGFLRLARELEEVGRKHEAMLCWRILQRMAPADTRIVMQRVSCALDAGALAEVDRALEDSSAAGVPPRVMVRFSGELVLHGHTQGAGLMLARLACLPSADQLIKQSPSIVSAGLPNDIGELGKRLVSMDFGPGDLLSLARLAFAFRQPGVAAALFARGSTTDSLGPLDRVAMLHALAEVDSDSLEVADDQLSELMGRLPGNPEALGMLVKVALCVGNMERAREALLSALRIRHGEGIRVPAEDCLAILEVLATLRDVDARLPPELRERERSGGDGIPKVFLCGFGWTGSGALYDEIRSVAGFCEFEGAGVDAIINQDADSEVTFVQGPGGLGDLWRRVLERGAIPWHVLWETFNLHVAGLSSIGYAQYKSSAAAHNHVRRYGSLYTRPFRRFLEDYAELRSNPRPGGLHASLRAATESLCSMVMQESNARAVLFNNAIFGRNAVMLEIFSSHRAAIVYRDPRDVYVDRRDNDLNHWRTPAQLASFYAHGLHAYNGYKGYGGAGAPELREVSFERFVRDAGFRARVRAWLLGELESGAAATHFDPVASCRNIGIHVDALSPTEQAQLQPALDDCRILDELSDHAWGRSLECDVGPSRGVAVTS